MTKHYTLTTESKVGQPHSPIHAYIQGTKATIVDAEIGQRGWLCYYDVDDENWHRIHTSTILNITVHDNGNVTIETLNTYYNLEVL